MRLQKQLVIVISDFLIAQQIVIDKNEIQAANDNESTR